MRQTRFGVLVLILILSMVGSFVSFPPSDRTTVVSAAQTGPIVVTVTTDKPAYAVGEPIRFTLTAQNVSSSPAQANGGAQEYDFDVQTSGGAGVWRWSADKAFIAIYRYGTLAPGERKTFTETWDQRRNDGQPIPAGSYRVLGFYTIDPLIEASPVQFTVGAPTSTATPSSTASATATGTATPTATATPPQDASPRWLDRPPTSAQPGRGCPGKDQWLLAYWGGGDAVPIATAAESCITIGLRIFPAQYICADGTRTGDESQCALPDLFWVSRGGRWLGFAKAAPDASDTWNVIQGEAHFLHGR